MMKKILAQRLLSVTTSNHRQLGKTAVLYILTFKLIKHTDGLDDIPRVGKNLNDVVLHGAHHTEPRLETCNRNRWGEKWMTINDYLRHFKNIIDKRDLWDNNTLQNRARLNTYNFWSAPVSTCSWQREGCKWDTAVLNSGSKCFPYSAGQHQFDGPGSTSSWDALGERGPSGASQSHHHCHSLDIQCQH